MRTVLALTVALALAPPLNRLQPDFQPLLTDFSESGGKVRLVMLLSPT